MIPMEKKRELDTLCTTEHYASFLSIQWCAVILTILWAGEYVHALSALELGMEEGLGLSYQEIVDKCGVHI